MKLSGIAKPDISVVMSVYNNAGNLHQSIESILRQESVNLEFIIVNDGSTDESAAIISDYAKQDSRIISIVQQNRGLTLSLVRGCMEARAPYIARQDADDLSHRDRLHQLLSLYKSDPDFVMTSSWGKCIGPDGDILFEITRPSDSIEATRILLYEKTGPPCHGSMLFRKDAYHAAGGYREEFYYGQDADLWLRLGQIGRIGYVPEFLYSYRYTPNSISSAKRDLQKRFGEIGQACHLARMNGQDETKFLLKAAELRAEILSGSAVRTSSRSLASASHYFLGSGLYSRSNRSSRSHFWKAIRANPFHWRAWIKLAASLINTKNIPTQQRFGEW